jgi:hypothetical protein
LQRLPERGSAAGHQYDKQTSAEQFCHKDCPPPNDDSLLDGDLILALRQGLKAQLERQLNSTRTTDLVERAQSSASHVPRVLGTAEALAQRELGLAELRI